MCPVQTVNHVSGWHAGVAQPPRLCMTEFVQPEKTNVNRGPLPSEDNILNPRMSTQLSSLKCLRAGEGSAPPQLRESQENISRRSWITKILPEKKGICGTVALGRAEAFCTCPRIFLRLFARTYIRKPVLCVRRGHGLHSGRLGFGRHAQHHGRMRWKAHSRGRLCHFKVSVRQKASLCQLQHQLAGVFAAEQFEQRVRKGLQPFHNIFF